MTPEIYDAWYDTPRGRWIGETEFSLLNELLASSPDETLLDVGCGTGWFTRRLAESDLLNVTGLDPNAGRLNYADQHYSRQRAPQIDWIEGDAQPAR